MNPLKCTLNRRNFIALAGGSCAVVSAVAIAKTNSSESSSRPSGPPPQHAKKNVKKITKEGKINYVKTDVLVVGGGMAGVFAAVKAHDAGAHVIMVDKGSVGKSGQTPFARGIFRYDEKTASMTKAEFLKKTADASEYMNNPVYTKLMLDHSAECVDQLKAWGFFEKACYAESLNRPLKKRKITIFERITLTHLLKEDERIAGAMGMFIDKNESLAIQAKSVILCTGASGFKPSGWQIGSLTSDGDAMAYRIGAEVTGKEWVDGHSRTNYGLDGLNRVVGSDNNHIDAMLSVEENIEVSKNGPSAMGMMGPPGTGHGGPSGDSRMAGADDKSGDHRGPPPGGGGPGGGPPPGGGHEGSGGPVSMGGASAGMSQHKAEGLFPQDDKCSSNIPGLYAAGDALGSMQSGGVYTQVGSSLAGSAVQGALAGKTAAEYAESAKHTAVSKSTIKSVNSEIYAPLLRTQGFSPQWVTQTLQGVMIPNFILYVKKGDRMLAALTYIEYLRDHQVPLLMANDLHELRQAHETANMILNAEMKLRSALLRTESRGSHYREDYPKANDNDWLVWIKIRQNNKGRMELVKHKI